MENSEGETVWTKKESRREIEPILLARKINKAWLDSSVGISAIRFTGPLLNALTDLTDAARAAKKSLPTNSLRLMLQTCVDDVIQVDRDLGCKANNPSPAIRTYQSDVPDEKISSLVAQQVRSWCINFLEVWAQKEQFADLAVRVKTASQAQHVNVSSSYQPLRRSSDGVPDYPLIARLVADQLAGQELFEGMGACEIVMPQSPGLQSIALMSAPKKPASEGGGKCLFSMVANIHVSSVPYSQDVYFSVSCGKRVWAQKAPDGGNTGSTATAFVFAPGRPVLPVDVKKRKGAEGFLWNFAAEYPALNIEARGALPPDLAAALTRASVPPGEREWWVGLPQITRLYKRVEQHTPLESDEVELMRTVCPMLQGFVDEAVPMVAHKLSLNKKPESAMLRLQDLGGAGVSIADPEAEGAGDEDEGEDAGERGSVARFREQCIRVLKDSHPGGSEKPALWIVGGSVQEQACARKTAEVVFGEAIEIRQDPLPPNVHGLKSELPGSDLKSRQRFDLRVKAWRDSGLPQAISTHEGPRFVLICAPKMIGRRSEDAVNRRAAIHAMCVIANASVHHVLPVEAANSADRQTKSAQAFIHRVQSAMLDVMLAHSGYVIGARDFVDSQLALANRPQSIYGIQALRKQAQQYSGETPVSLIIYSRLNLQTCMTEVCFVYRAGGVPSDSDWMSLAKGLIWLGCQRRMDGDEDWLRVQFQPSCVKMLSQVSEQDPQAIVFVDWAAVRGLWPELNDAKLEEKAGALDYIDLTKHFPQMSFVRLRESRMPLRSWNKTNFKGFREESSRQATGAYFEDGYATTVKQLVEINPDSSLPSRAHFVGVMGARKTFQLKRGKSCFRFMTRMSPADKDAAGVSAKGIFVKTTMPPADMDATIPASTDITVVQSPDGVSPLEIATLAMGLRVGYAHYDDWTKLPAPLFFARKIDDYIIKYPASETDLEEDDDGPAEEGEPYPGAESGELSLVVQQVQRELNLDVGSAEDEPSDKAEQTSGRPQSADLAVPPAAPITAALEEVDPLSLSDEQLIERARTLEVVQLYPASGKPKLRRIHTAMLQGKIKIHVDLPYFVQTPGFFGAYSPSLKKNIQKSWKQIVEFGFVPANKSRPTPAYYLDWLADKLRHPQGAYIVDSVLLFGRRFVMPVVAEIYENFVRIAKDSPDGQPTSDWQSDIDLIVRKACEESDDRTLGWLVFAVAQMPGFGYAEAVFGSLSVIPGPMTRASLHYYLASDRAINMALRQADESGITGFKEIHLRRTYNPPAAAMAEVPSGEQAQAARQTASMSSGLSMPAPQSEPPRHALTAAAEAILALSPGASREKSHIVHASAADQAAAAQPPETPLHAPAQKPTSHGQEIVMQIKAELKVLIDEMEPGSEAFAGVCEKVAGLLDQLRSIDDAERESRKGKAEMIRRRNELGEMALAILDRLRAADEDRVVGGFRYVEPDLERLELAQAEVKNLDVALAKVEDPIKQILECMDNPLGPQATRSDHVRWAQRMSGLDATINDELIQVRQALELAICFESTENPVPPSSGSDAAQEGEGVASLHEHSSKAQEADPEAAASCAAVAPEKADPEPAAAPEASAEAPVEQALTVLTSEPQSHTPARMDARDDLTPTAASVAPAVQAPASTNKEVGVAKSQLPQPAPAAPPAQAQQAAATAEQEKPAPSPAHAQGHFQGASLTSDESDLQVAFGRLKKLMDLRHYGLAGVYIDALSLSFGEDAIGKTTLPVLLALNETLESIDCRFTVDSRLNAQLKALLTGDKSPPALSNHADIGILAAGFVSAIFSAPHGGAGAQDVSLWTVVGPIRQPLARLPAITGLIDHIVSSDAKGVVLTREKFAGSKIGIQKALAKEIERTAKRAENWKKDAAIHGSWSHHGFGRMHDYIYGPKHAVGQCVALVANDNVKALKIAFAEAQSKFFRKPAATVVEAFKAVGEKSKPDGRYSVNACENIAITEAFIKDYIDLSENSAARKDALPQHELEYLTELHVHLSAVMAELDGLHPELLLEQIYISSARTIFDAVLRLFSEEKPAVCLTLEQQKLLIQQPMDKFWSPSMRESEDAGMKAVCSGETVIGALDELLEEDLSSLPSPIADEDLNKLLVEAQRTHIQGRRFLPAFFIENLLPRGFSRLDPPLQQQYQKAKADLSHDLQGARQRVTHAMALSALDQKDSTKLLNIIEGIHASNTPDRGIGHPEGPSSAYPDFPHALAKLENQVIAFLDSRLEMARAKLLSQLQEFEESHGDDSARDVARIRNMLSTNNPASIRTAHDVFAILRSEGKLPFHVRDSRRIAPKEFESFLEAALKIRGQKGLLDALEAALSAPSSDQDPDIISGLSGEQRTEAAEFISKWKDLCAQKGEEAALQAGSFFASLGISAPTYMPDRAGRHLPTKFEFPGQGRAFAALSGGECFIPPALGSSAKMVVGYVVSGHHPENELSSLIQDVSSIPTFILSRASLSLQKRAKLSGQALVLLIDDHLIAYMAVHPEDRARRMMEICTLTFHTVPYSAEGTYVPREMFFGRQRELISLRAVNNLAVLYGGRRLGKSSLLSKIESEEGHVSTSLAIYIPMDRDYDGNDHVYFGWSRLAMALASRGVIEPVPRGSTDWRVIREWVENKLTAKEQKMKSCYLLFDEADNIMARELDLAEDETGFIRSLQRASEDIRASFHLRFVIAGLHNLARMTTESNSALGKAETIALEPFSSEDDILRGIELVTNPMAALGFFFGQGSEDLPLRVLSLCNFYPAFIQIYCRKLLEHMYNRRGTREAYAYITADDLEAVERDHDLLTELQQKFGWTLDLDKRYKAIALILADYYYSDIEAGKNEGLSVSEIRSWCEVLVPTHFVGMSSGAYEGLLDEMKKLTVLEKNGTRYRLRNPSIATLIGDRQRIDLQIKSLAAAPPEKSRNYGDRRNPLLHKNPHHAGRDAPIFPMPVAWTHAQMENVDGRLIILGGNDLSGLVEVCMPNAEWLLSQNHAYNTMSLSATSASASITRLRRNADLIPQGGSLLLLAPSGTWKATEIAQYASAASKAASSAGGPIRLVLGARPERLYEIARALEIGSLAPGGEKKISWSVSPVPPWSLDALRLHLRDNIAVAEDLDACQAILDASCGFGRQIQSICAGNLTAEKAMGLVKEAERTLAPSLEIFYDKIGMPKSIPADLLRAMEEFMQMVNGEQRNDANVDEFLGEFDLKSSHLQFLNWIGLVQEGQGNTWYVPSLYYRLISG